MVAREDDHERFGVGVIVQAARGARDVVHRWIGRRQVERRGFGAQFGHLGIGYSHVDFGLGILDFGLFPLIGCWLLKDPAS